MLKIPLCFFPTLRVQFQVIYFSFYQIIQSVHGHIHFVECAAVPKILGDQRGINIAVLAVVQCNSARLIRNGDSVNFDVWMALVFGLQKFNVPYCES